MRLEKLLASLTRRFWKNTDKNGPIPVKRPELGPCWNWKGNLSGSLKNYGYIWSGMRYLRAHRVAWKLLRGDIPKHLQIDHLCRNTKCVNPRHMELVTGKVNILRGESSSAKNARKTICKRGHPLRGRNVRLWRNQRICRACHRDAEAERRHATKR